jgi:hypothetical protein
MDCVVLAAPVFGDALCLTLRVEQLAFREFIPQPPAKAFAVAAFSRAARRDEQRLHAEPGEQYAQRLRHKL